MGVTPLYKPAQLRHDELLDVKDDPILRTGAQHAAGTLAGRPPAGRAGRYYYVDATDPTPVERDKLYRDTGGAWQEIAQRNVATGSFAGSRIYRATAQSIPTATLTAIAFSTESFDAEDMWIAGSPTRLTVPATRAGKWLIVGGVSYVGSLTGLREARIAKNGTDQVINRRTTLAAAGESSFVQATALVEAAAGNYFELFAYQDSGGALNTVGGFATTWFAAQFVGT